MKQELISLNSDTINRDHTIFPISVLEKGIKEHYDKGIPMCIGHDRHRPIGVTFPFALYMEPNISRMLGRKLTTESVEDQKEINELHQYNIQKNYYEGFSPYIDKFLPIIEKHIKQGHTKIVAGCASIHQENICFEIFPELFEIADDDGLTPMSQILSQFSYLGQGVFKHKTSDLAIYAHNDFRRSQSIHNNFHFYFLDELVKLTDNDAVTVRLRIDKNIIGYAPSYHDSMEMEYHWGPKFTDDISAIKTDITRHECNDAERAYHGISATEFYWKVDGNEKTFELEELKDHASPNGNFEKYNCRYVHSIYLKDQDTFVHFDGAIRSYDLEGMLDRLNKNFKHAGRNTEYRKLFRIDGKLPLEKWKLLIIHYMQDNPLIYEYFGVGQERESQKIQLKELDMQTKLLPFAIKKESGIRLLVSYHKLPQVIKTGRYIDAYDVMSTDSEKFDSVEHLVYEIKKSLQKIGEDLEISPNAMLVKIHDRYWNIPSVMHGGPDAANLLSKSVEAYKTLFAAIIEKRMEFDIAFTFSCVISDRLVRVSAYGNIETLLQWMSQHLPFPLEENQFSEWIQRQRKYLEAFQSTPDDPVISSLVQYDGVLFIKRSHVKYPYEFIENEEGGLSYKIEWPEKEIDLLSSIGEDIQPRLLSEVNEMKWSDTNEDYITSNRSKWLDPIENAGVVISKWGPLGLYWSKS